MPYAIRKQGDSYNVVKRDTGEIVSHHDTRDKARKAIRAIYANEGKSTHPWFASREDKHES